MIWDISIVHLSISSVKSFLRTLPLQGLTYFLTSFKLRAHMITIRLSRTGKHKAPQYRIVVQEKGKDPWSPALEILGHFNPRRNPVELVLNKERATEWLAKGAQPSETVYNMFVDQGLIKGEKRSTVRISKKRQAKMNEIKEAEEQKKRDAEEAAKVAAEAEAAEKAATEATPTEESTSTEETNSEAPASEEAPVAQ